MFAAPEPLYIVQNWQMKENGKLLADCRRVSEFRRLSGYRSSREPKPRSRTGPGR